MSGSILEQAQIEQASILLSIQGQSVVIKRGSGVSETTVYSGLAILSPIVNYEDLDGGYKVGFESCHLTLPASVSIKRSDKVTTADNNVWIVSPLESAIKKADGFNILQIATITRKNS